MRPAARRGLGGREQGSAVVDFVLVGALVTVLVAAVLQLALTLHVRATLIDCAAEGARHGALAGSSPGDGVQRTRDLIASALSPTFADDVAASVDDLGGAPVLVVSVRAPLPIAGLLGPSGAFSVTGRALMET